MHDKNQEISLHRIFPAPLAESFGVVVTELGRLLRGEVLFLVGEQVLLHLLHDMFCLVEILDIQVRGRAGHLLGMAALRAELPLLEAVHVRERAARRTPDDEVHTSEVIGVIVINKYRRFAEKPDVCRNRPRAMGRSKIFPKFFFGIAFDIDG